MRAIWTMAMKDLRLLAADKLGFFFVFFWPLLYAVFFGVVTSRMYAGGDENGARPIRVVAVDEDQTAASQHFLQRLSELKELDVQTENTRAAGADVVRRGTRAACIIVPQGYGAARGRIFWGDPLTVEVITDPSRAMEGGMLQGLLFATGYEEVQHVFTDTTEMPALLDRARESIADSPDLGDYQKAIAGAFFTAAQQMYQPEMLNGLFGNYTADSQPTTGEAANAREFGTAIGDSGWQPFRVEMQSLTRRQGERMDSPNQAFNAFAVVFPQGVAWGVMACAATFALTLVVERTRGTLPRLAIAPIARAQILGGKAFACFLATMFVSILILLIARVFFGVIPASLPMLALGIICVSIGVVGVMMLFSVLGKTEASVGGLSWAILVVMAMLGGGMLPLHMLSGWMETLSFFSIFRWAILAMEGAIWRGFSLAEMALPCGILLLIGAVGFTTGITVFRLESGK